ncbi:12.5 kDa unknown protein [Oyster mushroom spherical virus]|uniref:12.5 kDa unknown protein n=1 Tax=Oyster mushroom spherical virus TaxID=218667 RepID=UPI0000005CCC|nr:12.5 kDa unknown protein [Oyster mushroom spherical virus]AAO26220.1 12.5 kDa unknown protein [Oyster mushroom spherical virus]
MRLLCSDPVVPALRSAFSMPLVFSPTSGLTLCFILRSPTTPLLRLVDSTALSTRYTGRFRELRGIGLEQFRTLPPRQVPLALPLATALLSPVMRSPIKGFSVLSVRWAGSLFNLPHP